VKIFQSSQKVESTAPNQLRLDHRVYANLKQLVTLEGFAQGLSFLPKFAVHSILSGRHSSRLRGRGLDFEELRDYRVGDDIRSLDWKVSNRTRKPHVRVHSEERERDVLLLVDQRSCMFFGSQSQMKSVTAVELAALAAWRVLSVKDRVGALVFNDHSIEMIKPQRSRTNVMRILHQLVSMNHQLNTQISDPSPAQLDCVLLDAVRLCKHDYLLFLISDLNGWSRQSLEYIQRIKAHNDVIVACVTDPLESQLPKLDQMVVSNGQLQIQVDTQSGSIADQFSAARNSKTAELEAALKKSDIPLLNIDTVSPVYQQLLNAIGMKNFKPLGME
jgi:uncharacterized protein (DUF58 family)